MIEGSAVRATFALTALVSGSCLDSNRAHIEYASQTQFFDVFVHDAAILPCAGELETIDRLMLALREECGLDPPSERVNLHLWAFDAEEFPCAEWAAGCFLNPPGEVNVRSPGSLHHEIAHAAVTQGFDDFYAEGLAETHASWIRPTPNPGIDPRPLFETSNDEFNYGDAAVFANYMIERFGPEVTYNAFKAASKDGPENGFSQETGSSVDEIADAFLAEPMVCSSQLFRCRGASNGVLGSTNSPDATWIFESPLTCSDPQTLGAEAGTHTTQIIEVTNSGTVRVDVRNGLLNMEQCAPCSERSFWSLSSTLGPSEVVLEAGRYALYIEPVWGLTVNVTIESLE